MAFYTITHYKPSGRTFKNRTGIVFKNPTNKEIMEVFSKGETLRKIEGLYNYKYFKYIYTVPVYEVLRSHCVRPLRQITSANHTEARGSRSHRRRGALPSRFGDSVAACFTAPLNGPPPGARRALRAGRARGSCVALRLRDRSRGTACSGCGRHRTPRTRPPGCGRAAGPPNRD